MWNFESVFQEKNINFLSFQRILRMSSLSLSDLHAMPEIPAIAHFCSLFKSSFDLIDFEIDELENALLQLNPDDVFSATLVERLVVKLLTGCLPMYASKIHDGNFSTYLIQLIQSKKGIMVDAANDILV